MSTQPPYRMPCEGVAGKPLYFLGSPFQHAISGNKVHKFANTTVVDNPDPELDPIPPFERWTPDPSDGGCDVHHCVTGPGAAPCTAWPKPFTANVFTDTGDLVDLTVTRKRGFKNVFARRSWHGVFPWTAPEAGCPTNLCADGSGYQTYQATPTQTKYLTLTVDASFEMHWDDTDGTTIYNVVSSASGSRTVNANSGEITQTISTSEDDSNQPDPNGGIGGVTDTLHVLNGAGWRLEESGVVDYPSGLVSNMDAISAADVHCGHVAMPANAFFGDGATIFQLIAQWNALHPDFPFPAPSDPNSYDETVDFDSPGVPTATYRISWARSATVYSWDVSYDSESTDGGGQTFSQTVAFSGSLTLADANTAASLKADLVTLLSYWDLSDDEQYPWRADLKTGVAPLMSRSEVGNTSPIGFNTFTVNDLTAPIDDADGNTPFTVDWVATYDQRAWFDPSTYAWQFAPGTDSTNAAATGLQLLFDGSILGAPKDPGYQDYFDFAFNDIRGCCFRPEDNPGFQTWSWYQLGWGQNVSTFNTNTGCHLPLNATQWNNWFEAINKPPCAFMFYSDQSDYYAGGCVSSDAPSKAGDSGAFVMGKWAEIIDLWPSQNFAMPAGDAKFWFDETKVFCAINASGTGEGSTWTLTDPSTQLAPPDATDFSGLWGGPVVGGFYEVDSYASGTLTLGAKVYDVPSNWISKSHVDATDPDTGDPISDEAFCFGKLRWSDKPSLLGRIAVTTTGPGTTFTYAAQPAFGMDSSTHQEQIDLFDASMTVVATNVTATRISDTQFSIVTGKPTAAFVMIHGAAKYYINDTAPKGDLTQMEWVADLRSGGEYNRLTGILDCDGVQVARPTTNAGGGPVTAPFRFFAQRQDCLPFQPCAPKVICISPNGETFPNGITYAFPTEFLLDEQYGSKWWGKVEPIMTDLFWQQPHRPCNIETCAAWKEDDGTCNPNVEGTCPSGEDSPAPEYFFGHRPQVEARLTVPANYGAAQDESAPALPGGIQIGWLSPVDYEAGDIALPPAPFGVESGAGIPNGGNTAWTLHERFCENLACRFDYRIPGCA